MTNDYFSYLEQLQTLPGREYERMMGYYRRFPDLFFLASMQFLKKKRILASGDKAELERLLLEEKKWIQQAVDQVLLEKTAHVIKTHDYVA